MSCRFYFAWSFSLIYKPFVNVYWAGWSSSFFGHKVRTVRTPSVSIADPARQSFWPGPSSWLAEQKTVPVLNPLTSSQHPLDWLISILLISDFSLRFVFQGRSREPERSLFFFSLRANLLYSVKWWLRERIGLLDISLLEKSWSTALSKR